MLEYRIKREFSIRTTKFAQLRWRLGNRAVRRQRVESAHVGANWVLFA